MTFGGYGSAGLLVPADNARAHWLDLEEMIMRGPMEVLLKDTCLLQMFLTAWQQICLGVLI